MADPATKEEYEKLGHERLKIVGFGSEVTVHYPCPFCCAPDWQVARVLDTASMGGKECACLECMRVGRIVITDTPNMTSFVIEHVAGADLPEYLKGVFVDRRDA